LSRLATFFREIGSGTLPNISSTVRIVVGCGNPDLARRRNPGNSDEEKCQLDQSTFEDPSIAGRYHYKSRIALAGHAFPRMNYR
jgi:hypothetical protein